MNTVVDIHLPASKEALAELKAGDSVRLFGSIYTMRDAGHQRVLEHLGKMGAPQSPSKGEQDKAPQGKLDSSQEGEQDKAPKGELPFGLKGQALFYAGPTPARAERPVGSIGPTTASRMDAAAPELYRAGINLTLGKGKRSAAVVEACKETGSIYLIAVGGAAAYLGGFVKESTLVAWEDLGTEALRCLTLEGFPAYVGIDSQGNTDWVSTATQH